MTERKKTVLIYVLIGVFLLFQILTWERQGQDAVLKVVILSLIIYSIRQSADRNK